MLSPALGLSPLPTAPIWMAFDKSFFIQHWDLSGFGWLLQSHEEYSPTIYYNECDVMDQEVNEGRRSVLYEQGTLAADGCGQVGTVS